MWPWQQKKLGKSSQTPGQLLWRVLQISVIGHLLVLALFLCGGHSSVLHVSMRSFPSQARIVCVPSFMLPSCKNRYAGKRGALRSSTTAPAVQKQKEKGTTVHDLPKPLSKRELRRERLRTRKLEREKKLLEAKEAALAARHRAQETAKEKRAAQSARKVVPEEVQPTASQELPTESEQAGDGDSDETVIYVDSATFEMSEVVKELQEALQQVWEAPAGFAVGYACEVKVTVSNSGQATAVIISKKSGATVYDTAARRAASAASYPRLVYNRTIVIHFGE